MKRVWDEIGYHMVTFEIRSAYQVRWILCLVMNHHRKCVPTPEIQYSYHQKWIKNLALNRNDSKLYIFNEKEERNLNAWKWKYKFTTTKKIA